MDYPIKAFEIKGFSGERIKLEISEVFGFPQETSFRGGYDIKCNLEISAGVYSICTNNYYSSTGALYNFYNELFKCHKHLKGVASYNLYCPENYLDINVKFDGGKVNISGKYQDDPIIKNILNFEFTCDQSYFNEVIADLKRIVLQFGDNRGIKK